MTPSKRNFSAPASLVHNNNNGVTRGGFLSSAANKPATASPWSLDVPRTVEERLQRKAESLSRQGSLSAANARRVAEETLEVATATLAELAAQTDGLERVATELDKCDEHVKQVRGVCCKAGVL